MPVKSKRSPSADEIAGMAVRGQHVSKFFKNRFEVISPVRRVTVTLTEGILRELDAWADAPQREQAGRDQGPPS